MNTKVTKNKKLAPRTCIVKALVILILVAGLSLFLGCAPASKTSLYVKDGKTYGVTKGAFRHKWWNYYERGLSFAEGEFFKEAVADLDLAVAQRAKDQRMARSYGMHFIDYFPHRELGVIYYQTGDLKTAAEELELSISHYESAKARFYLDRVRKDLIDQTGKKVNPPFISLSPDQEEIWTREDPVVISGLVEDENYVSAITINQKPLLLLQGSQKRISFTENLALSQGRHLVEVVAGNLGGQIKKQSIVIHVDRQGPMITIEELRIDSQQPQPAVVISGSVYDEAGVSELRINGRLIPIRAGVEVFFSEQFPTEKKSLKLVTADRLGNRTSAGIPMLNPQSAIQNPKSVLLAYTASDLGRLFIAGLFKPKDNRPPVITLRDWTATQTVFLKKVYIQGRVSDDSKVEALTINQIPILRRKGRSIFFSHLAELREGENIIVVEARDEAGNVALKRILIYRQVPAALQLEERMSLTVMPFEQKGVISEVGLSFQGNLINALVDQNRFRVIERDKLDLILQEQKLSRTKLFDRGTALRLGKLVAAGSIITGSIIETRTGIEIVSRMIDTETSEILATEDVYDEVKDLPALRVLAEGMALKFHGDFPLLSGFIIRQKDKYIFTDLGADKIKSQKRLIVYREESIKHPVTGKVLGSDAVIIGRARVVQVMPAMSKAEILDDKSGSVKRLDMVITE